MADKAKVPLLVEIVLYTNLELYSLKRQEQVGHRISCPCRSFDIVCNLNSKWMLTSCTFQNFKNVLLLMKEAFFKHGEKEALRSCVRAINFCSTESQGELQDFARNKLKELEDELTAKVKAAIKEVVVYFNNNLAFSLLVGLMDKVWHVLALQDGDDEYSLLVNLKRLYELQLSRAVPIESSYEDIVMVLSRFRNMEDEVCPM
jgi:cohesin complex subunit SA-1/2